METIDQTDTGWTDIYIHRGKKLLRVLNPSTSPIVGELVAIGADKRIVLTVEHYHEECTSIIYVG